MSTLASASTASSSSTSSPRCVPFAFRHGGALGSRLPGLVSSGTARTVAHAAPAAAGSGACGRPLCYAAKVLGEGIQNTFFTSLDRCSCVKVRTDSFKELELDAAPLMSPLPSPLPHDDSGTTATRSGRRRRASAGGKPRRGLGCCTPNSTSVN